MKKIEGNSKKTNFTKVIHSGISLIVLVITIIIIVILSTAILVSVVSNNPVMEANKARYESDTANMQAIFTNTVAKIMSQNRASIEIRPGRINALVSGVSESVGEVSYTVIDAMDINNTDGVIYFDKGTNTSTTYYIGRKLPIYSAGETKWYVDSEGNISLEVAGTKYGNGETIVLEGEGQTYHTFAPSTLSFRSTADLEDFKEVKINGETIDPSNYTLTEGSTIVTLSVEYLKTLEVDSHEITIVSKNAAPTAKFEVVEPKANAHNFYYNQPYTAYVQSLACDLALFIRKNNICDVIVYGDAAGSEVCTYSLENGNILFNTSMGLLNATLSNEGKELYCAELNTTFSIGADEDIVADENYIYIYDNNWRENWKGYEVVAIEKSKESYSGIRTNIYGIPVTQIGSSAFRDSINLNTFSIPKGIVFIADYAFGGCTNLKNLNIPSSIETINAWSLIDCVSLINISFEGTVEQWNNISKGEGWDRDIPATEVKCSNGVVPLK